MTTAFRFLALPGEIRAMVYREALVPTTPEGLKEDLCSLAQPPLARVSRQLRAEAIPIFYGENDFVIRIENHSIRPVFNQERRRGVDVAYKRYIAMFEAFSASGSDGPGTSCISHIKSILVTYDHYHHNGDSSTIGFYLNYSKPGPYELPDWVRICESVVDWADFTTVRTALLNELGAWVLEETITLLELFPRARLAAMLWFCAKECPLAAKHVELWYDELDYFYRDDSDS
ncbi:hypothetical protein N8I77_000975 [Diaporthe amygdali]|uniref:Uncharacterized protein n=1 Tax=Phomopsis amygdali TaxID=1214568 RepID=A0AAD9SPH6_PHOAM|nr:hypothetical protein N8I77_000975 [Diaporthe amygdali]